jgi:hypothetical protein
MSLPEKNLLDFAPDAILQLFFLTVNLQQALTIPDSNLPEIPVTAVMTWIIVGVHVPGGTITCVLYYILYYIIGVHVCVI